MTRREGDVAIVIATVGGMWTGSRHAEPMSVLAAVVLGLALLGVLEVVDWPWSAIGRRIDRDPRPNPVTPQLRLESEEMSDEIKPALTAEERAWWEERAVVEAQSRMLVEHMKQTGSEALLVRRDGADIHVFPVATWAEVKALRTAVDGYRSGDFNGFNDWNEEQADLLEQLAARIAALLPPRDP